MLPILMYPAFRHGSQTPWGGSKLREVFGKEIPDDSTGEALELSAIPGLNSRDQNGRPLEELIDRYGMELVGTRVGKPFPLLLKLLDAREQLSVQVHPDDAFAAQKEGKLGKTEAWLVISAQPGAKLREFLIRSFVKARPRVPQHRVLGGTGLHMIDPAVAGAGPLSVNLPEYLLHGLLCDQPRFDQPLWVDPCRIAGERRVRLVGRRSAGGLSHRQDLPAGLPRVSQKVQEPPRARAEVPDTVFGRQCRHRKNDAARSMHLCFSPSNKAFYISSAR